MPKLRPRPQPDEEPPFPSREWDDWALAACLHHIRSGGDAWQAPEPVRRRSKLLGICLMAQARLRAEEGLDD
jgi:hypothetical protein